jgi:hypothetical protein
MSSKWAEKPTSAKATTVFAVIFLVSAGLCGANIVAVLGLNSSAEGFLSITAYAELAGMLVGLTGLIAIAFISLLCWIIRLFSSPPEDNGES